MRRIPDLPRRATIPKCADFIFHIARAVERNRDVDVLQRIGIFLSGSKRLFETAVAVNFGVRGAIEQQQGEKTLRLRPWSCIRLRDAQSPLDSFDKHFLNIGTVIRFLSVAQV